MTGFDNKNIDTHKRGVDSPLVLILGGARSGKSTFAERLAIASGKRVAYIATATAGDEDMQARIRQHQAERPAHWRTIEEPLQLARAVRKAASQADVILLDCMTVWLSNWLFSQGDTTALEDVSALEIQRYMKDILLEVEALLAVVADLEKGKMLVVVSNEVGLGIVPAYALGRLYRDMLGRVNQRLAAAATRVYLMIAGLGVDIKRLNDEALL